MGSNPSNLAAEATSVTLIVQPIHLTLAILTNSFNIFILTRRRLYSLPCTHYFLVYSIFSIIYTCFSSTLQILRMYGILWTNTPIGCRLQSFIVQTTALEASLMTLLATIDRFCSSSPSAKLRSLSNPKFTRWLIIVSILIYILYMLPLIAINYWENTCVQHSSSLISIYYISQIVVFYIITLSFTGLFSFLTWLNIRHQIRQIAPHVHSNRAQRIDRQLFRMMLLQSLTYLIFTIPYGCINIGMALSPSMRTSFYQGLRTIFTMWQQCIYFLGFFLYTFSAKIYREEIIRLFHQIYDQQSMTIIRTGTRAEFIAHLPQDLTKRQAN